jgi:rod shape-determining protein MreC
LKSFIEAFLTASFFEIMNHLIQFIKRFSFFLLFLLLEVVAVLIMINHTSYRSGRINNFLSEVSGSIFSTYGDMTDYFYLKQANDQLVRENGRLRMMLNESHYSNKTTKYDYFDTIREQQYLYIETHVIQNSTNKQSNYVMIDKGSNHGVEKNMGVLSPDGIVGYVVNSSPRFSWVLPVLNKDSRFSVKVLKNNQLGTLTWEENSYRYGTLNHIPGHVNLRRGDTIVTSGFSHNIPANVPVGTVEEFNIITGEDFYRVKIKFFTDYNQLHEVYVVKNLFIQEQDSVKFEQLR